jgi:hypothetical protein
VALSTPIDEIRLEERLCRPVHLRRRPIQHRTGRAGTWIRTPRACTAYARTLRVSDSHASDMAFLLYPVLIKISPDLKDLRRSRRSTRLSRLQAACLSAFRTACMQRRPLAKDHFAGLPRVDKVLCWGTGGALRSSSVGNLSPIARRAAHATCEALTSRHLRFGIKAARGRYGLRQSCLPNKTATTSHSLLRAQVAASRRVGMRLQLVDNNECRETTVPPRQRQMIRISSGWWYASHLAAHGDVTTIALGRAPPQD